MFGIQGASHHLVLDDHMLSCEDLLFRCPDAASGVRIYSLRKFCFTSSSRSRGPNSGWSDVSFLRGRSSIPLTRGVKDCAGVVSGI